MGSLIPFQDLNLIPDPTTTPAGAAGSAAPMSTAIVPKLEPKMEPFDEPQPLAQIPAPQPYYSSSSSTFNFNSQPASTSFAGSSSQAPVAVPEDVYSEFYRISEQFRTAFADKLGEVDMSDPDARAIVPVPDNTQLSTAVAPPKKKYQPRSSELVRVTDLGVDDQRYFRDVVRRTRMVYDSLRILAMKEDEKIRDPDHKRTRGDLKASSTMRERGMWLNRDKRIVGTIPGVYIGDLFFFRMELCVVGLHGQPQAGIDYLPASQSSNREPIATSVIVSGGYEDDEDQGDVIIYTGHGGQDEHSRQCAHQKLEGGNLALERSMHYGIEVRVIRGLKYEGGASAKVYVYDGLYRIYDTWFDVGKSGFGVYKFRLMRIPDQPEMGSFTLKLAKNIKANPLSARPTGYLSLDIAMKKEKMPVYLYNDIDNDHEPLYYEYTARVVFPPHVYHGPQGNGCGCASGCMEGCPCAMKNGGDFPYDQNGILLRGKPLIFECGPSCQCPPNCRNRVSQRGVRNRFEVFRSRETGWGVRSLDLIQAGAFICEYTGVALTREQADIFAMNGDSLVYPSRFGERWAEWGDLSHIFTDYVRPSYPAAPPLDFAIDVSRLRNVACYVSHSSSPNVLVQLVLYDHNNLMFPHLMLFAMENIPPLRELSLDYGVADEWSGKPVPLRICN